MRLVPGEHTTRANKLFLSLFYVPPLSANTLLSAPVGSIIPAPWAAVARRRSRALVAPSTSASPDTMETAAFCYASSESTSLAARGQTMVAFNSQFDGQPCVVVCVLNANGVTGDRVHCNEFCEATECCSGLLYEQNVQRKGSS